MQLYFKTREKARQFKSGKLVDHGKEAPQGKRFARDIKDSKPLPRLKEAA